MKGCCGTRLVGAAIWLLLVLAGPIRSYSQNVQDFNWFRLSTHAFQIPFPGTSIFQTAAIVADFDQDGVNDFVIAGNSGVPSVTLFRRLTNGWLAYDVEKSSLPVGNGGAIHDINGDGYPDIVLGGDERNNELWWWENPRPPFDSRVGWRRHTIKRSGKPGHSGQVFGDFKGTGHPQLVFWNQGARALFLAEIPPNPRAADVWPYVEILSTNNIEPGSFVTAGLTVADIDGDGKPDIMAGNHWLKYQGDNSFKATRFAPIGGKVVTGQFVQTSSRPQIIVSVPDGRAPLRYYECTGDPTDPKKWVARDLYNRLLQHCATLQVVDINGDGLLDIFAGEMVKWTTNPNTIDNKNAVALAFFGNGRGQFRYSQFIAEHDFHDCKLADLDGDGDIDVLYKPYRLDTPRVDVWLQGGTIGHSVPPMKRFQNPVGLSLGIFGPALTTNLTHTLAWTAQIGMPEVALPEMSGLKPRDFRKQLDTLSLKSTVVTFPFSRFEKELDKVAADAKQLGAEYVVCTELKPKGPLSRDDINRAASDFNQFALRLRPHHIQFCYAIQGNEFGKLGNGTMFDDLAAKTTVGSVRFVLSVPAVVSAGADPILLMRRYPNRFAILNIADMRQVPNTGQTNSMNQFASVVLGQGQSNIPQMLIDASRAGVRRYFLEDRSPAAVEQIPQSMLYLRDLRFN